MTKLDELSAAYAASTPGEWRHRTPHGAYGHEVDVPNGYFGDLICQMSHHPDERAQQSANAQFIALAHNMMPALLEAAKALDFMSLVVDSGGEADEGSVIALMRAALAKLT